MNRHLDHLLCFFGLMPIGPARPHHTNRRHAPMIRTARTPEPHWLITVYPGRCAHCGAAIPIGSHAYIFPNRALFCDRPDCGRAEATAYTAALGIFAERAASHRTCA